MTTNYRAKLAGIPVQALALHLCGQFDEIIIVGRKRPVLEGVDTAPDIFIAGKGDYGDQMGLAETLKLKITTVQQMSMLGGEGEEG